MSPEMGVLFVALLWGPTALWLVYRTLRGHRGRLSGPFSRSQLAPDELEASVDSDGFWACGTCSSLNRGEANRCYSCRTAKGSAGRQAPSELPVSPGVPVMADSVARSSRELPVSPGVPVMAASAARSSGEVAGTTLALATPRNAPPVSEVHVRAPEKVLSAAPSEAPGGVPVCPFLGLRKDPSTRYDFPDPGNSCRAAGARRPQPISVEHQKSRCLTAAHEPCARYVAVEMVAANR